ncbi:PucR family transcriptional regulator [Microbacterium trichothecenolyticum]|uniref:Purine catabolism regulator n=1 Tax=Microbacterium trichothecenolyticum TaxID=69370 RepID=A0ABU0TWP5_MICTR|nr:PucR family transcriptional regulator [Microbacterium trichothecenolyticum]MDQ1124093.1 purine catabolism regulator [Microbacterium trichothecenolyticum]
MPASLRVLLESGAFDLRPVTPLDDEILDHPISWVHSSDMLDPTPWLERGNLLLTNGAQFSSTPDADEVAAYCRRLRDLGAAGLGFAVDVIHPAIPRPVVEACAREGVPLIQVAGPVPFIGIIRFVADLIAADRAARFSWLLDAQRSVARAAVRDDGLREILRTLSRLLDTWVELYDAAGAPVPLRGLRPVPRQLAVEVGREVRMLLERRTPASLLVPPPDGALLQTIGQSSRLRGVLAVGAREPLDPAGKDLVATVVALASVALEQQRQLQASLRGVRSATVELLLGAQRSTAERVAETAWGGLPTGAVHVAVMPGGAAVGGLLDELDLAAVAPQHLFYAPHGDDVVVIFADDVRDALSMLVERHRLRVGTAPYPPGEPFATVVRQAAHAARSATAGRVSAYDDMPGRGLVGVLREGGGDLLAQTLLQPLAALPSVDRRRLRESARAWIEANGAWDPAARALGIHRHTLKARIAQLERVLELDLSTFAGRAELWAALELRDDAAKDQGRD